MRLEGPALTTPSRSRLVYPKEEPRAGAEPAAGEQLPRRALPRRGCRSEDDLSMLQVFHDAPAGARFKSGPWLRAFRRTPAGLGTHPPNEMTQ